MISFKSERLIFLFVLFAWNFRHSDTLKCYQCDSWRDSGCSENSYLDDKHYSECYIRTNLHHGPIYCLKQITTFTDLSNTKVQYHQPHVVRRCSVNPSSKAYRFNPQSFQLNEEYYEDDCERKLIKIDSIPGTRKICTCETDGCNSAVSLSKTKFYGKQLFALTMSMLLGSLLISPV